MRTLRFTLGGIAGALAVCCLVSACHTPRYNEATRTDLPTGATPPAAPAVVQDENMLFLVSFSGGGTRAAAMSCSVLEQLGKIPYSYTADGRTIQSNLANEIDYVSGISGGSFAAAAWALYGDTKGGMAAFRKRFVERDIQGALLKNILWPPWRMFWLLSPRYDRIHIAAELYDRDVFDGRTFESVPPHPELRINATNLSLGNRFTFAEDDFALIGSDLSKYPIGFACAASSAFPVLLSPITLKNHGTSATLNDREYIAAVANSKRQVEAELYVRMRKFYNAKDRNRFVHLADGGLVDNQGLQAILDEFQSNGRINKRLNGKDPNGNDMPPLQHLVILNVNAGVVGEDDSSQDEDAPGIAQVLGYTTVLSMDLLSAKRWVQIREQVNDTNKRAMDPSNPALSEVQAFAIEINFRNLDEEMRDKAWALPTTFALDEDQLAVIDESVAVLMQKGNNKALDTLVARIQGDGN
jgi:predicted acylesterase/phospholipase RssA